MIIVMMIFRQMLFRPAFRSASSSSNKIKSRVNNNEYVDFFCRPFKFEIAAGKIADLPLGQNCCIIKKIHAR